LFYVLQYVQKEKKRSDGLVTKCRTKISSLSKKNFKNYGTYRVRDV
jgi:hypothetical protein